MGACSLLESPSFVPERLRDELERTHTEISQLREIIDFSRASRSLLS